MCTWNATNRWCCLCIWRPRCDNSLMSPSSLSPWLLLRKDMVNRWAGRHPPEDHADQACEYARRQPSQSVQIHKQPDPAHQGSGGRVLSSGTRPWHPDACRCQTLDPGSPLTCRHGSISWHQMTQGQQLLFSIHLWGNYCTSSQT